MQMSLFLSFCHSIRVSAASINAPNFNKKHPAILCKFCQKSCAIFHKSPLKRSLWQELSWIDCFL